MRPRLRLGAFVLCWLTSATASALAQPELTGVWEPIPEASTVTLPTAAVAPDAPVPPPPPRTVALSITQRGTVMTMNRRLRKPDGQETVATLTYTLDGQPTVNRNGPIELTTTAAWEGDALVLSSKAALDGRQIGTVRERYALLDDQLVVESARQWGANQSSSRDVHRRR